jgi:hypothetical protein
MTDPGLGPEYWAAVHADQVDEIIVTQLREPPLTTAEKAGIAQAELDRIFPWWHPDNDDPYAAGTGVGPGPG